MCVCVVWLAREEAGHRGGTGPYEGRRSERGGPKFRCSVARRLPVEVSPKPSSATANPTRSWGFLLWAQPGHAQALWKLQYKTLPAIQKEVLLRRGQLQRFSSEWLESPVRFYESVWFFLVSLVGVGRGSILPI